MKRIFQTYSVCAIMAPWLFLVLRMVNFYNFKCDSLVFGVLFLISAGALFMNYKTWEK